MNGTDHPSDRLVRSPSVTPADVFGRSRDEHREPDQPPARAYPTPADVWGPVDTEPVTPDHGDVAPVDASGDAPVPASVPGPAPAADAAVDDAVTDNTLTPPADAQAPLAASRPARITPATVFGRHIPEQHTPVDSLHGVDVEDAVAQVSPDPQPHSPDSSPPVLSESEPSGGSSDSIDGTDDGTNGTEPSHHPAPAVKFVPPGNSPLRVDPTLLRPRPGAPTGSRGGLAPLPPCAPPSQQLPVIEETSAGGVVVRPPFPGETEPSAAVITRRNRAGRIECCLPKGHLENTETAQQAARREVFEETGIIATVHDRLGLIDYWFSGDTRRIHKVVHHFLLRAVGGYLTVLGDPDREAESALWVPLSQLPTRLSYPNEQKLVAIAIERLTTSPHLVDPEDPFVESTGTEFVP